MVLFVLIGILIIAIVLFLRPKIFKLMSPNHPLIKRLSLQQWFQNFWLAGLSLFFINAFLFVGVAVCLYALTFLFIPFIHLAVMIGGVIASFYSWIIIHKSWQGTTRNRFKVAFIGSSFYAGLCGFFVYKLSTLQPRFPGDDTFMAAVGLWMGIIVAGVAFCSCLLTVGVDRKIEIKNI